MDYKLTFEDGSEAIAHYGIQGMKWGVWNSETASRYRGGDSSYKGAKKTVRQLNRLDKRRAIETGKAYDMSNKLVKIQSAETAARYKGNESRLEKLGQKREAFDRKFKAHSEAAKGITETQNQMLKQVRSDGYSVKLRDVRRSTLTKGEKAVQVALNVALAAAGSNTIYAYNRTTPGTKFKLSSKPDTVRNSAQVENRPADIRKSSVTIKTKPNERRR